VSGEDQRSDRELLVKARGCAEPFGVFYERHFASVLAFFRPRTAGVEEAFDLAAETTPPRDAPACPGSCTRARRLHRPPRDSRFRACGSQKLDPSENRRFRRHADL